MPLSLIVLLLVIACISLRACLSFNVPIWGIMLFGALFLLASDQISWKAACHAVDLEVMGYLLGVFIIAQGLEQSGCLDRVAGRLFLRARTGYDALWLVTFVIGITATFFMNDAIAILGTLMIVKMFRHHLALLSPLLLSLAYSITIASVMSPIGNPQNLLIATGAGFEQPFFSFLQHLCAPTMINLGLVATFLSIIYRKTLKLPIVHVPMEITHSTRAFWCSCGAITLLITLIVIKIILRI